MNNEVPINRTVYHDGRVVYWCNGEMFQVGWLGEWWALRKARREQADRLAVCNRWTIKEERQVA